MPGSAPGSFIGESLTLPIDTQESSDLCVTEKETGSERSGVISQGHPDSELEAAVVSSRFAGTPRPCFLNYTALPGVRSSSF